MTSSFNRRSLMKGAAWAAPAVIATTTIPAYAASSANTTPKVIWEDSCNLPYLGYSDDGQTVRQWFTNWVRMENLPKDVFVDSIEIQHWFSLANPTNGHLNGFFCWSSPNIYTGYSRYQQKNAQVDQSTGSITWKPETPGSGWSPAATGSSATQHTYANGQTFKSCCITTKWDSKQMTINDNYFPESTTGGTTKGFNTYDSGWFMLEFANNFNGRYNDSPTWDAMEEVMVFTLKDKNGNIIGTIDKAVGSTEINETVWHRDPVLTIVNDSPSNPLHGYVAKTHKEENTCTVMHTDAQYKRYNPYIEPGTHQ